MASHTHPEVYVGGVDGVRQHKAEGHQPGASGHDESGDTSSGGVLEVSITVEGYQHVRQHGNVHGYVLEQVSGMSPLHVCKDVVDKYRLNLLLLNIYISLKTSRYV